jgi:hypothetical protein
MKYIDGTKIYVGDRVELVNQGYGVVVCSIDDALYMESYAKDDWSYLEKGVLIKMDNGSLIHYTEPDCDLKRT